MEMKIDKEIENSVKAAELEFREEPMDDYYSNLIAGYPSRLRVRKILKELGDIREKKVLDIGCEAGHVSMQILKKNPRELHGIDVCQPALDAFSEKLEKANVKTKVVLKKAFMQEMPFKNESFDHAVCTEVIEHVPKLHLGIKEVARVLKKDAKFILTFPNEKLRKLLYPIVKMLGINTDVEKDVTLFERDAGGIINLLRPHFIIEKAYRIPWFFPITNVIVARRR